MKMKMTYFEDDISSLPTDLTSSGAVQSAQGQTETYDDSYTKTTSNSNMSKSTLTVSKTTTLSKKSKRKSSKNSEKSSSEKTIISKKSSVKNGDLVQIQDWNRYLILLLMANLRLLEKFLSFHVQPIDPEIAKEIIQPRPDLVFGLPRDKTGDAIIDAAISGAQTKSKVRVRK